MVEERRAGFERHRHRRPVDLGQDVVGQVGGHVELHHALHVREIATGRGEGIEKRRGRDGTRHGFLREAPARDQLAVQVVGACRFQVVGEAPHALAVRLLALRRRAERFHHRVEKRRRQGPHGPGAEMAQGQGQPPEPLEQPRPLRVAVVAREQLVPPVARKRDRHVPAGELRHQVRGDLRTVGEGLVVDGGEARDHVEQLALAHVELGMFGAEMRGHGLGVLGLVVTCLVKADREGQGRAVREVLHQRDHGRGIDAARQERAQGHVRHELAAYRVEKERLERTHGVLGAVEPWPPGAAAGHGDIRGAPVEMPLGFGVFG